jgi:hypothetical protein
MSANRMTQMGYTLGIVAIFATFAPPALFAAPLLGLLAIAFGRSDSREIAGRANGSTEPSSGSSWERHP